MNPQVRAYLRAATSPTKRTPEGLTKGIDYFQQAIEKDPRYALPYSGLADAYVLLATRGSRPVQRVSAESQSSRQEGLELDNTVAEAHTSLAQARTL